jgi:PAS domain S-box-containing protein
MYHILYVDDESELLEIGKLFLERSGLFAVDTITSAPEALRVISEKRYDAIISDYQMPGMDGIEFLKHVRASGNTVPFIIFTGRGREEVVIQALNEGADFYLQKGGEPLPQFAELANAVQKAVLQRRAEVSIRDHERREADIINFLPDATFAIDTYGVVIAWNRAMEKMTGVPADQILGKGNYEYAIPFYHERRSILIDLILSDDPATEARYPYVTRAGTKLFSETLIPHMNDGKGASIWFTASPLYDTRGKIVGAIESIRDITERKQAESELRAAYEQITATEEALRQQYRELAENERKLRLSEARYRNVVEVQTELISRFLPDGTHVFVNEAYCRYFGKSREEIIEHIFIPNIPVEDRGNVKLHFASLTPSHPVESIEHRIMMPGGEIRWQRWNDRAIFDEKGNITEFQSVGRDITDRMQAEEALRESEERYRFLIENASVAIGVIQEKKFIFVNKRATDATCYTREEMLGLPFITFVHPEDRDHVNSTYLQTLQGKMIKEPYDFRIITKSGSVRWLDVKSVRISWNKKPATLSFFIDITEQKKAEDALLQANRQLNLMTSLTRHDINNQITILMGFLRILEKEQSDPALSAYFQKISTTAKRISAMIRFTKEYEKIGVRAPVWQDTHTLIDAAVKEVPLGNVIVKNDLPSGTEMFADPLIVKVFYNLMDNAARYGEKISTIRFSVQESGENYLIVCEDDGEGIPAKEKEKIFDRGFGKNTGLGLFFAREILSITGITIRETGEPGKGARFEIVVPKGAYRFAGMQ